MVQISWMQLAIIGMHRDWGILELDHDLHALAFAAGGKLQQGMLIKLELRHYSIQARAAVFGHKTILTANFRLWASSAGNVFRRTTPVAFSSGHKYGAPTGIQNHESGRSRSENRKQEKWNPGMGSDSEPQPKHHPDFGSPLGGDRKITLVTRQRPSARRELGLGGVLKLKKARPEPGLGCWVMTGYTS
jgi:hypothetical protein